MKKLILIAGILVAGNILMAQDQDTPREKAKVRIETFKARLELTDAQEEQWKELREKYQPEMKAIRADDSKSRSDKLRAVADVVEKRDEELSNILSSEQLAELVVIRSEVKETRKDRRSKRMGGKGKN